MDEQEKNPGEMTPEVPAEETAPQAEDTRSEVCSAPEQPELPEKAPKQTAKRPGRTRRKKRNRLLTHLRRKSNRA